MAVQLEKRLFTVDEYHRMLETGILKENDRVELIRGEVVQMPSTGPDHAACVARLTILFAEQLGRRVVIWPQNPVRLSNDSEPEPDEALLKPRDDFYAHSLPTEEDVLLAIEVSYWTLDRDRKAKMPLYAGAGIEEAWIVNVEERIVEVYTRPEGGIYQQVRYAQPEETLPIPGFPDVVIKVEDVLE